MTQLPPLSDQEEKEIRERAKAIARSLIAAFMALDRDTDEFERDLRNGTFPRIYREGEHEQLDRTH